MSKILLAVCSFVFVSFGVMAQDRVITGKVTSKDDGTTLPGVNVVVKGTTIGSVTDADGKYVISVPESNNVLQFSFIGMLTTEVEIGGKSIIDVSLASDATQLSEIIVTETGYSQERKFTGSSGVLKGETIQRTAMASLDQNLQGRIAGVLVNSGSGQPGSSATVRIRGVGSIAGAGAQPLYVVDGVPVLGNLSGINANDIVSQTVLKDGVAGALYGARGANGVIVITTKKGQSGVNSIDFRTQVGLSLYPRPKNFSMMNTEQALAYEEKLGLAGFGINGPGWAYSPLNPTYAAQTPEVKAQRDALLAGFKANDRDYYDDLFRNGFSSTNELVARGGTDKTKYYASFNIFDQDGFAANSDFTRYTGRVNIDHQLNKVTIGVSSTIVRSVTNTNAGEWLGNSTGNPFQMVWRAKPYEPVYKADGSLDFGASTGTVPRTIANNIERAENTTIRQTDFRILGGFSVKYEIIKGLSIRNNFGIDFTTSQGMYSVKPNSYVGSLQASNSGLHTEAVVNQNQIINTTGINYGKIFDDKHEVEVGAYFEAIKVNNNGFGYQLLNLDKRLTETGQGAGTLPVGSATTYPQNATGAKSEYGIRSYFATARYIFNNRYTANFNGRVDGTSRIVNKDNKEIFTWSAGLGWDVSNEAFMASQNIVSDLRVRASYGEVPNIGSIPPGNFGLTGGFFNVPNYLGPQLPTFGTTNAFAGSALTGLVPTSPGNPDLKIETIQKLNVGFDITLFKRASLTVDFYRNMTVDMFVNQPLGGTTGFGGNAVPINAGKMSNKGVEITLTGDIYKKGDWTFDANFNHAININKIEDLGAVEEYPLGTFLIREGLPYGSHYTFDYIGADPATGRPTYRQLDGTTTTNSSAANQVAKFGTFLPKHTGGFGFSGSWKKIQLSTFFTYQFDVVRSNNVWSWTTRGIPGFINAVNQSTELLGNQWEKADDVKFYHSPAYDRGFTSTDLMDAKFLRFREVTVSYTLPKILFAKEIRVYGRAQNLAIWSPWKGLDPEDNNNISLNEYPNPRLFTFGIDFSF